IDISHSRPHRVRETGASKPFEQFLQQVQRVASACEQVRKIASGGSATVRRADARRLPLSAEVVDLAITSPPYLNAIDYLRGHKFSLVWMGWTIGGLREVRSRNIGSEKGIGSARLKRIDRDALESAGDIQELAPRYQAMVTRYVRDLRMMMTELARVLKPGGLAVLVIGDSN